MYIIKFLKKSEGYISYLISRHHQKPYIQIRQSHADMAYSLSILVCIETGDFRDQE